MTEITVDESGIGDHGNTPGYWVSLIDGDTARICHTGFTIKMPVKSLIQLRVAIFAALMYEVKHGRLKMDAKTAPVSEKAESLGQEAPKPILDLRR